MKRVMTDDEGVEWVLFSEVEYQQRRINELTREVAIARRKHNEVVRQIGEMPRHEDVVAALKEIHTWGNEVTDLLDNMDVESANIEAKPTFEETIRQFLQWRYQHADTLHKCCIYNSRNPFNHSEKG